MLPEASTRGPVELPIHDGYRGNVAGRTLACRHQGVTSRYQCRPRDNAKAAVTLVVR